MQAKLALEILEKHLIELFTEFLAMPWYAFVFILFYFALLMFILRKSSNNSKPSSRFNFLINGSMKYLTGSISILCVIIVSLPMLALIFQFIANFLSVGEFAGRKQGLNDIAQKVCINIEDYNGGSKIIPGCSEYVDIKGTIHKGTVLRSNDRHTIMITNTESILFSPDKSILLCSPIINLINEENKNNCPKKKEL
ncbi:hypothetical protein [Colwellia sp. PAMC 21821]|uniref:hypothetical protein n=1 Tax=Colwellia sp. PAMC 21821 TaxID=1816219 RepID=UPI0012DDB833|nr:hypothetical protein [Colwellia sp. PAMC 21821]